MGSRSFVLIGTPLLVAACGCASTTYVPRSDGRIAFGNDGLFKNGQLYGSGDVDQLVAGDSRAEEEARNYRTDQTISGACSVVSVMAFVGALVWEIAAPPKDLSSAAPTLGLFVGAVVVDVVGSAFSSAARRHLFDAVNIYNDDLATGHPMPAMPSPAPRPSDSSAAP